MANQDHFDFRHDSTPSGPRPSQPEYAPPLPPRPRLKRRPVASAATPQDPFPSQTQFGGSAPSPPRSPPTYNFSPPNDPPSPPTYGFRPDNEPFGSFSPPACGLAAGDSSSSFSSRAYSSPSPFAAGPSQFTQAPESQPQKRHSVFGSTVRQIAKVVAALASPDELNPAQPAPCQPASVGMQAGQVIVNGVVLGQPDLLALQSAVGAVSPGSYW